MIEGKKDIDENLKETVIVRVETIPSNLKLSIGGGKMLTKEEIIEHVKKGDETGKEIVNSHLSFMKAIARGEFTSAIASV